MRYYFGCWGKDRIGHYLYDVNGRSVHRTEPDFPVNIHVLDGGLLPPNRPQVEGEATVVHINGWTILSFWDRSADRRPNSNSNFIFVGEFSFEQMIGLACLHFPTIWGRFNFDIQSRNPSGATIQGKGEYPPPSTPIEFTGEWRCEYCGAVYAEYVNGCPKCFMGETGTSSKVVWVPKLSTPNGSGSSGTVERGEGK